MIDHSHRPARPRARRQSPSYPRGLSVGALAVLAACAGTTMACGSDVYGPNENKPTTGQGLGGNVAGGIENPWGGGGTGGEAQGGAGGASQGGQGGEAHGGAGGEQAGGNGMGGDWAGGIGEPFGGNGQGGS